MVTKSTVSPVGQTGQEFLTTEEYAAKVRASVETIRAWRKRRYGPQGFRLNGRVLYPAAKVDAWLEQLSTESNGSVDGRVA